MATVNRCIEHGTYLDKVVSLSGKIDKVVIWVSAILLVLMTIDILVAVFFRYVVENTLIWSEELARYMMIWMASLAMSCGIKDGTHLTINFLTARLSNKVAFWLDLVIRLFLLGFLLILTYYGLDLVIANLDFTSQAAEVNMAIPTSIVPLAGCLMIVQLILSTILKLGKRGAERQGGQTC